MFTRLSSSLSHSRYFSTAPNKAIVDLLTRCRHPSHRAQDATHLSYCLGLREEDSSPSRNAYKMRSYQVAIAAIHGHERPIRSGQEAIKVRH